jgi:hypothetical protein
MSRWLLPLVTVLAIAVLAVTIVGFAAASKGGTPTDTKLAPSTAGNGTSGPLDLEIPQCRLPGGPGPSSLPVSGVCKGKLTGPFACLAGHEQFSLTIRRPLGGGNEFWLTIEIPDYVGPGPYAESEAFVQITGPANAMRWTHRETLTRVDPSGFVELGRTLLTPETGTPAKGRILLFGHAECREAFPVRRG